MTVGELIVKLQAFDPELPIFTEYQYLVSEDTGMDSDVSEPVINNLETRIVIGAK